MSDDYPTIGDVAGDPASAEHIARQQAEFAASQQQAGQPVTYPYKLSSGGYNDGVTVYPDVYTWAHKTQADAQAAIDDARAKDLLVLPVNTDTGAFIEEHGGEFVAVYESPDSSRRYSASDHSDGK